VNYYPFNLGDYAAHTAHLEPLEDLAYRRMLDLYYMRECALPRDAADIARLIRMKANVAEVEVVLAEFFAPSDEGWTHTRADKEIAKFRLMGEGGKRGAAKRWAKGGDSPPIDTPMPTKKQNQEPNTEAIASAASAKPPRAVRKCPESFSLTAELLEFAAKFPAVDYRAETEKLRDHTFKNAISDWPGAWRNWIRRAAENLQQARASPMSFAERDELAAIARVHEMTGGLVSANPFTPRRPDALQEVFDARTAARKMDHVAVRPAASSLRLGLVEQVEGG
jgi:uncharacterized protein YdaU (DUF1376 family)